MGEAVYHYKATFRSDALTEELQGRLRAFHIEASKAYDYWQDNRDIEPDLVENFWQVFKVKFPTMYEFMKLEALAGDKSLNKLSGMMSWGTEEDADNLSFHGDIARYNANVWHFADWEKLGAFLKYKFGAIEFKWISEEYANVADMLDDDDNDASIVAAILKKPKKELPLFMGIHPALDARIQEKMKPKKASKKKG